MEGPGGQAKRWAEKETESDFSQWCPKDKTHGQNPKYAKFHSNIEIKKKLF